MCIISGYLRVYVDNKFLSHSFYGPFYDSYVNAD